MVEIELNNAYWAHDNKAYKDKIDSYKTMGFKIYRDSNGNHKVVKIDNNDYINNLFGDIFKGGN